jgi:molybdenum ABC transporter ATP-binding protein
MASLDVALSHRLRAYRLELSFDVAAETVALVGPSGAGKSSVLRAVAGLLTPDEGHVRLGGETWLDRGSGIDVPAEQRRVGLVFQDYALFPHLSVESNVAFGAREPGLVDDLLERFGIGKLARERPGRLSGGERQRVALARALAREPGVLLLDEPLSALDAHTKASVRAELHELLAGLGLPTLLVTHDFEDAAALAGRIGVLVDGRLLQIGTPEELVATPSDPFVASFTGANLLAGTAMAGPDGLTAVTLDVGGVALSTDVARGRVALAVHPWEVSLARAATDDSAVNHLHATVLSIARLGNRARVRVGALSAEVTTASVERLGLAVGDPVVASFKATAARLLPM